MYKLYFKQAIQMLKQNKFISIISIVGTALAIMMVMTIILADEVKNINAAPEDKRDRMLYIEDEFRTKEGSMRGSEVRYEIFNNYLSNMQTPEYICPLNMEHDGSAIINREGSPDMQEAYVRYTDACYWNIFSFPFIKGRAFTPEEAESGVSVAVISESTAKKLFKDQDPIGKEMEINFFNYKIIGVVKDISAVFKHASGDVWVPYKSKINYEKSRFLVILLAKDRNDFPAIIKEVRECERKVDSENDPWKLWLKGPETNEIYSKNLEAFTLELYNDEIKIDKRKTIMIFLILIIVPAINLSGFSLSRIKKRREEIGVRKAFGAKNHIILFQVLYENMITSLIGGIIGLALSYFMVLNMRHWLLGIPSDTPLPVNTMISLSVFIAVFIVSFILNILSAGIPAYRASRIKIIDSLNQKEH